MSVRKNFISVLRSRLERTFPSVFKSINKRQPEMPAAAQFKFRPMVVSGPSGGGKSTILKRLFKEYPNAFAFSVSHTTRGPRPGEQDGVDYHFVQREQMESAIRSGDFLEHAEFGGNLYGTSLKAVEAVGQSGRICILDIDLQGVRSVKQTSLRARYVFVKPPSFQVLEERLKSRATENEDSLQKRLNRAREDMAAVEAESELFDHVVINDDLDQAYKDFKSLLEEDLSRIFAEGDS